MLSASSKDFQFRTIVSLPRSPNLLRRSSYLQSESTPMRTIYPDLCLEFWWSSLARATLSSSSGSIGVSAPTPCIMYHGPFFAIYSSLSPRPECPTCRKLMDKYFFMNECHRVPLNTVIDGPSSPELNDIADRSGCHFDEKRPYTGTTIGSLCAMPCHLNHPQPFPSSFVLFPTTILLSFVSPPITLHSILNGRGMVLLF